MEYIHIYSMYIYILTLEDTGGVAPVLVRVFLEAALHHPIYADTHMYIYTHIYDAIHILKASDTK